MVTNAEQLLDHMGHRLATVYYVELHEPDPRIAIRCHTCDRDLVSFEFEREGQCQK